MDSGLYNLLCELSAQNNGSTSSTMLATADEHTETTESTSTASTVTAPHTPTLPAYSISACPSSDFVSQFRIDGHAILPPLMTAEKRCEMQQLKQLAIQLEERYTQARAVKSNPALCSPSQQLHSFSPTAETGNRQLLQIEPELNNNMPKHQQLQQTETYIFDSTQQERSPSLSSSFSISPVRSRPNTLQLESETMSPKKSVPAICVDPPTPQLAELSPGQRRINSITGKILHFEQHTNAVQPRRSSVPADEVTVLWQRQRATTSPSLQDATQSALMQRSHSFTLEEPSQVLLEHMQRQVANTTATAPRGRAAAPSSSTLLRDTVESKGKRVQRNEMRCPLTRNKQLHSSSGGNVKAQAYAGSTSSASPRSRQSTPRCSSTPNVTRECGSSTLRNQQQLEQLLESTLKDSNVTASQGRMQLALAKRRMFNDIKRAHRDRFQQLVDCQREEQRRMQEAFDRQQRLLIEDICEQINVSTYVQSSRSGAPHSVSECTSTADLTLMQRLMAQVQDQHSNSSSVSSEAPVFSTPPSTPAASLTASTPRSLHSSPTKAPSTQPAASSARKRLFGSTQQQARSVRATDILPLPHNNNNNNGSSSSNNNSPTISNQRPVNASPQRHARTTKTTPAGKNGSSSSKNSPTSGSKRAVNTLTQHCERTTKLTSPGKSRNSNNNSPTSGKSSPQRRQTTAAQQRPPATAANSGGGRSPKRTAAVLTSPSPQATPKKQTLRGLELQQYYARLPLPQRRLLAASKIAAFVRGFLVRRLFRTEQVQRLVQTIRDTLIFVLNLHMETFGNSLEEEAPANIRLKARLLQQLCSASRALHLVFFQTSIKDRMEIISRDRKRIKTKLMAMHLRRRL